MILLLIFAIASAILLCVYKAIKKSVLKILAITFFSAFLLSVGWVFLWQGVFKEETPDPKVIEVIKGFDWTDEKKISDAGIKVDELSNGEFGIRKMNTEEYDFYIIGGLDSDATSKKDYWITDGDFSYYYEITSDLNEYLLIPDRKKYSYWFQIGDVWLSVHGENSVFEVSDFDRFVLEKLK